LKAANLEEAVVRVINIELTDEERRVAERFIKTIPGFTMEKYVTELKKLKEFNMTNEKKKR
jgi:hypothetical protein